MARSGRTPTCTGALRAHSGLHGDTGRNAKFFYETGHFIVINSLELQYVSDFYSTPWDMLAHSGRTPPRAGALHGALWARSDLHWRTPGALRPARAHSAARSGRTPTCIGALPAHSSLHGDAGRNAKFFYETGLPFISW